MTVLAARLPVKCGRRNRLTGRTAPAVIVTPGGRDRTAGVKTVAEIRHKTGRAAAGGSIGGVSYPRTARPMSVIGLERIVYGVDDLALCRRFFTDWGLAPEGEAFHALDGTAVVLRAKDDPALPPPVEPGP